MTWTNATDYLDRLHATLTTGEPSTDPPDSVVTWLAKLRLLEGVPFFYLVPDARMLPPESLRFFQVDMNWVDALIDGAFSIGRSTTGDADREASRTAVAKTAAVSASATLRTAARARAAQANAWIQAALAARDAALAGDPAASATLAADADEATAALGTATVALADTGADGGSGEGDAGDSGDSGDSGDGGDTGDDGDDDGDILTEPPVTGFVLRSAVVSGWPQMEVRAYQDAAMTQKADILRLDRLADDILFGLFGQEVAAIQFSEPAETLHFGFEIPENPGDPYVKILKYVNASGHAPGSEMTGVTADAPWRDQALRVVDVATLQQQLRSTLVANGGIGANDPWTAAEFALEMVQGVEEVNYTLEAS